MMYYKIINDRMVFSDCKTIQLDGHYISNPSAEQIADAGWQVYVPPIVPPQPQNEPAMAEIMQAVKQMLSSDVSSLTDKEALGVAALYPTWSSLLGKSVTAGKRVWDDGRLWKVLQPHTFQQNWRPADSPSLFVEVSVAAIPDWVQPSAGNAFMTGDQCRHNGHVWESLIDNNVWEPGSQGTELLWTQID